MGGAEVTAWDLAGAYSSLARTLTNYSKNSGKYYQKDIKLPSVFNDNYKEVMYTKNTIQPIIGAGALYSVFAAMTELTRPDYYSGWKSFNSSKKIAWKTGTSIGLRDAWAVGITTKYTVVVWVGNATGEGRPTLTGLNAAAPILFDVFDALPSSTWFEMPYDDMIQTQVSRQSGYRANEYTTEFDTVWIPKNGMKTPVCPFTKLVHVDQQEQYQVNSNCASVEQIKSLAWFVLPPAMEYFYRKSHVEYKTLPPFKSGCISDEETSNFELVYPEPNAKLKPAKNFSGKQQEIIFEAAHRKPETKIYWHIDNVYVGQTQHFHQLPIHTNPGKHLLTVTDADGKTIYRYFEITK